MWVRKSKLEKLINDTVIDLLNNKTRNHGEITVLEEKVRKLEPSLYELKELKNQLSRVYSILSSHNIPSPVNVQDDYDNIVIENLTYRELVNYVIRGKDIIRNRPKVIIKGGDENRSDNESPERAL